MDTLVLILQALAPIAGKHVLDIGCGRGTLAKVLLDRSAVVTGIDSNADAVASAQIRAPGARFDTAFAEALPFTDAVFDGALFVNALHHADRPSKALSEAARVLRPDGVIVVVEPLASGSFFEALRPIEDETAVRTEAQVAIAAAVDSGSLVCLRDVSFERVDRFARFDDFLSRVTAVDPRRVAMVDAARATILATFERVAERGEAGGYLLRQPHRGHVLATASR